MYGFQEIPDKYIGVKYFAHKSSDFPKCGGREIA